MIKVLLAVIALIAAAMVAGVYFQFNAAIPIFVILGFGIYMVTRIGGPQWPKGSYVPWAMVAGSICAAATTHRKKMQTAASISAKATAFARYCRN